MKRRKEIFYESYTDDVVTSADQQYQIPEGYVWLDESPGFLRKSRILYRMGLIFANFYCPLILHIKVLGGDKLPKKGSFFLYGNHTQPIGDAFTPAWICKGRRIYVPISPANMGIPVIGKLLPYLGGMPIPSDRKRLRKFQQALKKKTEEENAIIVYPEAHVWPYYTKIRPYGTSSFTYPVQWNCPSYCMTSTYQKRRWGTKPKITIYIDGPYLPDLSLSKKEQKIKIRDQIYHTMLERSKESSYEYYQYTLQRRQGN